MVSSQFVAPTRTDLQRPLYRLLLLPLTASGAVPSEQVELDFSDVFGPLSLPSNETSNRKSESTVLPADMSEFVYDDPEIVHSRSHSLVGPSSYRSQAQGLGKLTIHEAEDSDELVENVITQTIKEDQELSDSELARAGTVCLEDFEVMKVVGQGAFGKVFQVKKKGTSEIYAMKVMRKDKIMEKNHAEYMKAERDILTKIDHPFIVQLRYSFQTKYRLYLVLDFINGGHLFFQLYKQGLFREDLARVYAAEIVSAVSHLHTTGIMHRDLKPENILVDVDGHVMLTDFGLAKQFEEDTRSNSMCGTVEYMSPEIVLGKGHDKAADWWSVGILLFEMLTGKPPFTGGNRQKIQEKIVKDKLKLPAFLSSEAHALLKGLLQKDPSKRLGSGLRGNDEIKGHKWFKPINWRKLDAREIQPSFRPEISGTHCTANFDKCWTEMSVLDSPASSPKIVNMDHFLGYTYVKSAASFLQRSSPLC